MKIDFSIDRDAGTAVYRQIMSGITTMVRDGKLVPGDRLPSERELAVLLGVSRVVVREALKSMEQFGLVETRKGTENGTYVIFNLYKPFLSSMNILFREGRLSLQDFTDVRIAVECLSVKLAVANATEKDLMEFGKETIQQEIQKMLKWLKIKQSFKKISEELKEFDEKSYYRELEKIRESTWEEYKKDMDV